MYKNYQQTPAYQQQKCSYEIYRKQCRYLHISTAKLGHEECEACILLTDQEQLAEHKRLAERAREEYQKDKERQLREDEALYTLDMQKIVCLPRLLQYKQLVFCKRLTVFHHTLAPVGGTTNAKPTISAVWDECTAGRTATEIISMLLKMIRDSPLRAKKHLEIWADNCSSQNKNYYIMGALWSLVNQPNNAHETLTLKFFEPGHTVMTADAVHAAVERKIVATKSVIDTDHFSECVLTATRNTGLIRPTYSDFKKIPYPASQRKLGRDARHQLRYLVVIQLRRGSNSAWVKKDYDAEFERFDFLLKKVKQDGLPIDDTLLEERWGIPKQKYDDMIKDLVPLIEQVDGGNHAWRAGFFHDLVCSDTSVDLAQADDEDPAEDHQ